MKNGEHAFHCPFCNHHKKKLQVNTETQKWHCWVCNTGGYKIGILLRKINAPKQVISEVLKILGDYRGVSKDIKEKTEFNVTLPKEFKPLWKKSTDPIYKNAIHYLRQRSIGPIDILRYSIGYCPSGGYSNRIIIPSYDSDGKLNYFMARDMFPNLLASSFYDDYKMDNKKHVHHFSFGNFYLILFLILLRVRDYTL